MGATLIGFAIGLVVGAATGSEMGAFAGGMLGMLCGVAWHGLMWMRVNLGDTPVIEHHKVMCTSFGHAAHLELEGDLERGTWADVKSCSLLSPSCEVDCDKGCLHQIRLAGVKPGKPCDCEQVSA